MVERLPIKFNVNLSNLVGFVEVDHDLCAKALARDGGIE